MSIHSNHAYVAAFEALMNAPCEYPQGEFRGQGIVIVAGGERYTTSAWVCIQQLRRLGCILPIEVWHLGPNEIDSPTRTIFEAVDGVRCIDALEVRKTRPMATLRGWECKPFSILYSSFEEVLYLDPDNFAVLEPSFLFATPQYAEHGAIFWPDRPTMGSERAIWRLLNIPYRLEAEFESGQIVVHKARCWRALILTCHLCEFGEAFWWAADGGNVYGDKDLFRFAWHSINQTYSMPRRRVHSIGAGGVLCQHDFEDRRVFQHRCGYKWRLFGSNPKVEDFRFEHFCHRDVKTFRQLKLASLRIGQTPLAMHITRELVSRRDMCWRSGNTTCMLQLLEDGSIGLGATESERWWLVKENDATITLQIGGDNGRIQEFSLMDQLRFQRISTGVEDGELTDILEPCNSDELSLPMNRS